MKCVLNYNTVLDLLEKHELLTSAWHGLLFDELPPHMQRHVEQFVARLREEIANEPQESRS
jgi:hypothetical protein